MEVHQLLSPNSGAITGLTIHSGSLIASTATGLVRMDSGTWSNLNVTFPVTCLSSHSDTLYAGTHGGVAVRTGDDKTWQERAFGEPAPVVTSIQYGTASPESQLVFAATLQDGVFRSTDRGLTWSAWNFGLFDQEIIDLSVASDETVVLVTETGCFWSESSGRSWRDVPLPDGCVPTAVSARGDHALIGSAAGELFRIDRTAAVCDLRLVFSGEAIVAICGEECLVGASGTVQTGGFRTELNVEGIVTTTLFTQDRLVVGFDTGDIVQLSGVNANE